MKESSIIVTKGKILVGLCVLMAAALPLPALAQIYKYTDADGIVHYTNVKPAGRAGVATLDFPCYASDPDCRSLDWERVPLNTGAFADEIRNSASRYEVDEALIRAIIHAESAYQAAAESPKGAQGLMQLMPATQLELEVTRPFDAEANIDGGTYHLSQILAQFDGDLDLAAAAYNAGAGAVKKYSGVPPYPETREYVRRVQILYRRYRESGT